MTSRPDWTAASVDSEFRAGIGHEMEGLVALARRMTRDEHAAQDAVQDALERAWRVRGQLRDPAALGGWLRSILARRIADVHRGRWDLPAGAPDALEDLMPDVQDPAAAVAAAQDEYALRAALRALSEPDRMAVVLHHGEAWPAAQVAELLGVSVEAAHKRIQRARARLLTALATTTGPPQLPTGACRAARSHAHDLLDGTLNDPSRAAVQEHLDSCPRCPAALQAAAGVLGALSTSDDPGDVPAPVRARLEELFREADEAS